MPKAAASRKKSKRNRPSMKQKGRATSSQPSIKKRASSQQLPMADDEEDQRLRTPVFFWKPNEDWGFLGQWYTAPMLDPETGLQFNCCEQYMMYHKAVTFNDQQSKQKIMDETDPRQHKALGRSISGFTEHTWDEVKFDIVVRANMMKFTQAKTLREDEFVRSLKGYTKSQEPPRLRSLLLGTGDRELVEASSRDKIWGIGFTAKQAEKQPRSKWGKNLLGRALMEVRQRLRDEEQQEQNPAGESTV